MIPAQNPKFRPKKKNPPPGFLAVGISAVVLNLYVSNSPAPEHTHAQQQHAHTHIRWGLLKLAMLICILSESDGPVNLLP
jgi:hypothetical protein